MALPNADATLEIDEYYIPDFLWNLWLEACPSDERNYSPWAYSSPIGLHVYDAFAQTLTPVEHVTRRYRSALSHIISRAPIALKAHPLWHSANIAFSTLEREAETAIRSLLQQVGAQRRSRLVVAGTGADIAHVSGMGVDDSKRKAADCAELMLGAHSMLTLKKYLIFLRFRNRDVYGKVLARAESGTLFGKCPRMRRAGSSSFTGAGKRSILNAPDIADDRMDVDGEEGLAEWLALLRSFINFFEGGNQPEPQSFDFISECIHRRFSTISSVELTVGLASEADEYILSGPCFGVVEEDGIGNLGSEFHYFYPITPHFTLYLFIDAPHVLSHSPIPPPHFLSREAQTSPVVEHDVEAADDIFQRNSLLLQTLPQYIIFASARSMMRTLTYYSTRRFLPGNVDYSKLLRGCREESVTYALFVRAEIEVVDLTDEVQKVGDAPVGHGAFADVWRGLWLDRQDRKHKPVALKVLRAHILENAKEKLLKRLHKEVLAWHRLEHPNIARLHGIMQLQDTLAMVSPWCENGTLVKYLKEKNPDADRLFLLHEIASGVLYLHNCSPPVVHGDLKGGNILIDATGHAVITDFGLAKVLEEVSGVTELPSSHLWGSTRWMAPELFLAGVEDEPEVPGREVEGDVRGMPITTYSDVYAFACVCLEVLTGRLPYANHRLDPAVTLAIMKGDKPSRGSVWLVNEVLAGPLWKMMDQCWDVYPRARPTMVEMEECLRCLVGDRVSAGECC